jgi:hypothetical protein
LPGASRCRSTRTPRDIIAQSFISKFILSLLLQFGRLLGLFFCAATPAAAHGFGQRFDLPLPLWLWLSGAAATLVVTFAVMALFVGNLRLPGIRLFSLGHTALSLLRLAAFLIFLLTLTAGFFGTQDPYRNLAPTMVWVLWWVGLAFVCALVVDLWALASPLALFPAGRGLLRYPAGLGAWPAVALFFCFAWAELVWRDNDVPSFLAAAVLAYAAITWAGMGLFGRAAWLEHAEAFSLAFGTLARFAPLEVAAGEVRLRVPGSGLLAAHAPSFSMLVFVLLMLASVTFDGFMETALYQALATRVQQELPGLLFTLSERGLGESEVLATLTLAAFPLLFLGAYWLTAWSMARLAGAASVSRVARAFVLSLVPIAVAYHLAHYLSLLLTAGQFVIPLASDPFGFGWNLFGTAGYKVDLGILSPYVFWYSAVALIVAGHAIAVFVAHLEAWRLFGNRRDALKSQVPLLVLMVAYTMLSLWILAQPIVG